MLGSGGDGVFLFVGELYRMEFFYLRGFNIGLAFLTFVWCGLLWGRGGGVCVCVRWGV